MTALARRATCTELAILEHMFDLTREPTPMIDRATLRVLQALDSPTGSQTVTDLACLTELSPGTVDMSLIRAVAAGMVLARDLGPAETWFLSDKGKHLVRGLDGRAVA
jgi:hypothetical protein